jgi:hypothetical protein
MYIRSATPLVALLLSRMLQRAGTPSQTMAARDTRSVRSPVNPWGSSVPAPCKSYVKPELPSSNPGIPGQHDLLACVPVAVCTALPLPAPHATASTSLHTISANSAGSGLSPGSPQKLQHVSWSHSELCFNRTALASRVLTVVLTPGVCFLLLTVLLALAMLQPLHGIARSSPLGACPMHDTHCRGASVHQP